MVTSSKNILQIAVPSPLYKCFDYLATDDIAGTNLPQGLRIRVPFGRREVIGILVAQLSTTQVPQKNLKSIIEIIDKKPIFSPSLWQLCVWISDYYHYPLGEVLHMALPKQLRIGKTVTEHIPAPATLLSMQDILLNEPLLLNSEQQNAVTSVLENTHQFHVSLLDGITGSGKTEVYLQIIAHVIASGKQALVLIPEIALTPQTIHRFSERFKVKCIALHSGLTERERLMAWNQANDHEAFIIIGTRSAIFTPMKNPGIIIIDEEHDLSYKQQDSLRYHARDVGVYRAQLENIPILLGSATPSLESFHNAKRKRYAYLQLITRAGKATSPKIHLIDLRAQKMANGLSSTLVQSIKTHLAQQQQVLLFLNRRGYVPVLMCHACGQCLECHRCDAYLTVHQEPLRLICHQCNSEQRLIKNCAKCNTNEWIYVGLGTAKLEQTLITLFPDIDIIRIDRDTTRKKGALNNLLKQIIPGKPQILLGTQMLAKGHHFPDVTLVAILDADSGLFSSDFRATERLGQLLLQVAGRAGRAEKPGEVVIQTHQPQHPLLQILLTQNYASFANTLLAERKTAELPPYTFMALIRAEAFEASLAQQFLSTAKAAFTPFVETIQLLGPIPPVRERVAGRYRSQLLLIASQRSTLLHFLNSAIPLLEQHSCKRKIRWSVDVDPMEL